MITRINIKTKWKVLIFLRKTNDWSRDFRQNYLLSADATRSRFVLTYSESTWFVISSNVDFESSVSWFWSIEIIFFDFTDSQDRREDQDARKWNN
jgi:hypothetical protein